MRSAIHATEVIPNRARKFGAATIYYPCRLVRADGSDELLLFTEGEIGVAAARAESNPEDLDAAIAAADAQNRSLWRMLAILSGSIALMAAIVAGAVLWPA